MARFLDFQNATSKHLKKLQMKNSNFTRKTEQMRKSFFLFGLVIALGVAHSALSYRLVEKFSFPDNGKTAVLVDDVVIPITVRPVQPKPIPQKEIKKTIAKASKDIFIVVDDYTYVEEPGETPINEVLSTHEEEEKEVFISLLDRKPIFSGCESLATEEDKFSCFQEKLHMHVKNRYKPNNMGWGSSEKMMVKFEIDKEGNIGEVLIARGEEHDKAQIEKIIKSLPQFTPGMYNGKYVKTSYVLPVVLRN